MAKHFPSVAARLVSLVLLCIMTLTTVPAEARSDANRSFTLAARQWLLLERMTNSALLSALGVEASPSLDSIHWSRNRFDTVQLELRVGDPRLGLRPATRPEIINRLDQVDARWRRYDSIFGEIRGSSNVTQQQIRALAASHDELAEALAGMVDTFEYYVDGGQSHTMLSTTIDGLGRLRARTQLVLRSLLTVAYDDGSGQQRDFLIRSAAEFNQTLASLINGDPSRRILQPPTPEIRESLREVDRLWREVLPILNSAASGDSVSSDDIAAVARYSNDMAVPLTMALLMYLSL